jgi:threonine aldolase
MSYAAPQGPVAPVIDVRSDTVTHPTPAMRSAMAAAPVGDDVFGDDPTILALEARAAALLGKEAAIFVPSGTMGNLVSLMAHVPRGGEVISPAESHIFNDEAANYAVVVGAGLRPIAETPDGEMPSSMRSRTRAIRTARSRAWSSWRTATRTP